jgi:ElaB/YqjD/DUF883 family membrane-anchored ribosome-binding protein
MKGTELIEKNLDRITSELKAVIKGAENLLKTTEKSEGDAFKVARAKFKSTLKNAKGEVLDLEQDLTEKIKDAAHTNEKYVKEHPWNVAGAGAGIGLLVGLLVARNYHGGPRHSSMG